MSYEDRCGSCGYYTFEGDGNKGYCSYYRAYYYPGDGCSHYVKGGMADSSGSSCYITTIVCDLMGFSDDCGELNILRGFRDNIMQKNNNYAQLLYQYDTVGPKIAGCLEAQFKNNSEEPDEMIVGLFNFYIQPTVWLIENKQYDAAVNRYTELTTSLMEYYGIRELPEIDPNYDYTQGGHGKIKTIGSKSGE